MSSTDLSGKVISKARQGTAPVDKGQLQDVYVALGHLEDALGVHGISWDFIGFHGIS